MNIDIIKSKLRKNFAPVVLALRDFKVSNSFDEQLLRNKILKAVSEIDDNPYLEMQHNREFMPDGLNQNTLLEINNTCNIDCLMCKTSLSTRKKTKMSKSVLTAVLDRLSEEGIKKVALHTIGDPLANPRLELVMQELRNRNIKTALSTNGLLLDRHIDTILKYTDVCNAVRFSIDGATKEKYEKIRSGGNWEDLLRNLDLAKSKLVTKGVVTSIAITLSKDNLNEVGKFIVKFRDYLRYPHQDFSFSLINSLSPDNKYFNEYNPFPIHTYKNIKCDQIIDNKLTILVNGETTSCCRDYNGDLITGNILINSKDQIFKGRQMTRLREAHSNNDLSNFPLCDTCFTVDERVGNVINSALSLVIKLHPREIAEFYQNISDQLCEIFEKPGPYKQKLSGLLSSI